MSRKEDLKNQQKINQETEKTISLEQELINILKKRVGVSDEFLNNQQDISNVIQDQIKQLKFETSERKLILALTRNMNKIASDAFTIHEKTLGTAQATEKIAKQQLSIDQQIFLLEAQKEKLLFRGGELNTDIALSLQMQVDEAIKLKKGLEKVEESSKEIAKNFGVKSFAGISQVANAIPGLKAFADPFNEASEAARETAQQNLATTGQTKAMSAADAKARNQKLADFKKLRSEGVGISDALEQTGLNAKQVKIGKIPVKTTVGPLMSGIKALGPALTKALGPVAIIIELVKGMMEADKQTVQLQKTMMMTKQEANQFNSGLQNAANASGNIMITGTKVLETFMSLSKEAGFVANFTADTLVSATKLQTQLGVSAGATSNLAQAAEATGTSLESNYKSVLGSSYEMQRQAGTQLDMKQILEETGAVTGQMRANMGGNTVEIAKAVTQAKLLGTSLEKVAAAGRQMLDFESSINKEMEAELMTGKQLNLDRARAAALAGDQETVAKELAKNMGDFTEFSKMNVLQQDALASAMGMTSDEMADMLFKQQVMGRTAKELREQGEDELAQKLEAKTAQDQMNAAMEKLKQAFVEIGSALMPIIEVVGFFAQLLGGIVGVIQMIIGYIRDAFSFLGGLVGIGDGVTAETSKGNAAAQGIAQMRGGVSDGVIDPEGNIISTDPADYLIATKTPGEMAGAVSEGGGGVSIDLGPLIAKVDQLIGVVEKGGDVILDGNKVGRNLAMASSKMG
jgi:hypothetical protein